MTTYSEKESPFIIWTMQRTGGTNLTKNLLAMSKFRAVEHEPFSRLRIYGEITKTWGSEKDNAALSTSIRGICAKRENIKHCVEMVPWQISATLVDAAAETDYKHLFLIRESSLQRLLSMVYARRAKVWGPR